MPPRTLPSLPGIQHLRAIAVLLVVFLHIQPYEQRFFANSILAPFHLIGSAGVDLFFVISGFIMVYVTQAGGKNINPITFFKKRLIRIYPLYWFYSFITLSVYLLPTAWVHGTQWKNVDLLRSFLLLPQPGLPLLHVGWTLVHELYFYAVFAVFLALRPVRITWLISVWGVFVMLSALKTLALPLPAAWSEIIFHPLTFEFIAGTVLGFWFLRSNIKKSPATCYAGILLAACGLFCLFTAGGLYHLSRPDAVAQGWLRVCLYGIPALFLCAGFILVDKASIAAKNRAALGNLAQSVGDASYSIYLSHFLVLSISARVLGPVFADLAPWGLSIWLNLCFILILAAICCVFGVLSFRLVERPLLAVTRGLLLSKESGKPSNILN